MQKLIPDFNVMIMEKNIYILSTQIRFLGQVLKEINIF